VKARDVAPHTRAVVERVVDRYGSDHHPLVTVLTVGTNALPVCPWCSMW
jgi:hypothetical protein